MQKYISLLDIQGLVRCVGQLDSFFSFFLGFSAISLLDILYISQIVLESHVVECVK